MPQLTTMAESTETPEPTDTTETPEPPEPTDTTEPGPSDDEAEAGDDAIERVQSEFAAAVEAYTGDEDGALADVSFTNGGFDVRAVLLTIDAVQRELAAAEAAAVTDDQHDTVSDLRVAERFLTRSALAHSYFVESVDRLDATRAAFSRGIDEVEDAENRFDTTLDRGSENVTTLKNDVDAEPVAVAEPFDDETYDATVSTFESVRSVLESASSGLDRMVQGMDELEEAREEEDDGNDDDAEERAGEALELFDEGWEFFDDAASVAGDVEADGLESLLEELQTIADEKYLGAEDLLEEVS
jgi:hypothetical protein